MRDTKGITLITLIITIIVLLILAGVTLNLILGENGLLMKAKESVNAYKQGELNDINSMDSAMSYMNQFFDEQENNQGGNHNEDGNNLQGGEDLPPSNPSEENRELTEEEKTALTTNNIRELDRDEIQNSNLKDNENIKGIITGEVPIPIGMSYKEGTKETGVVITDGTSEFVWVPVPNIGEMVRKSSYSDRYSGILYDFVQGNATQRPEQSGMEALKDFREPATVSASNDYDMDIRNLKIMNNILGTNYENANTFGSDLVADFNKMVNSVSRYKGFFVGRYETSIDIEKQRAYSQVGVIPATAASADSWYGMYSYQKKMAETNGYTCVFTHMIWGSNYDAMLRWVIRGADRFKVTTSGYAPHDLSSIYNTGSVPNDKINNIYDLEGNGYEWTAEALSDGCRTLRSGSYRENRAPGYRHGFRYPTNRYEFYCSRVALYIK